MKFLRKAEERGHADHGWLKTAHTFSFADYYDPNFMGFRALRVINEDHIDGGGGFPTHPHRDMEIVTYVLEGALQHRDSMGNAEILHPGEIQRMSAGTGVRHSEFNPDPQKKVHLFQIWLMPRKTGVAPSYEQRSFAQQLQKGGLHLVVEPAPEGAEMIDRPRQDLENAAGQPVQIHQDARIYVGKFRAGETFQLPLQKNRYGWLQMVEGGLVDVSDESLRLNSSDALALAEEASVEFKATQDSHFVFFDLN